ncbi:MAG: LCP family protein [Syntrophomonadaceae bacterium]|nr:LCP family protein [Syntrophomonadaceae bacterium]
MAFLDTKKGIVTLAILVFFVMMGVGAFLGGQLNSLFFESVQTKDSKGKVINILLMGIDARDAKANSRSDTMILASIDPATKKVAMVSIPRDTRIRNSAGKYDKINSVNYVDGPEAACREVGKLLNVPVDYYVITNFGGFGDIVDALGGVHLNVETNMVHPDPVNPSLAINLTKGYQYLNGKQALAYVRYRGGATADIGRTENQQTFIKALAAEIMQTKTILRLPQLIPELYKNVRTNLPLADMIYLANMAQKLDVANINTQTLPGYFYHDIAGASYWEADKKIASVLVESLLQGENFPVMGEAPASAQPVKTNPVSSAVAKQQEEALNKDEADTTEPATDKTEETEKGEGDGKDSGTAANEELPDPTAPDPNTTGGTTTTPPTDTTTPDPDQPTTETTDPTQQIRP